MADITCDHTFVNLLFLGPDDLFQERLICLSCGQKSPTPGFPMYEYTLSNKKDDNKFILIFNEFHLNLTDVTGEDEITHDVYSGDIFFEIYDPFSEKTGVSGYTTYRKTLRFKLSRMEEINIKPAKSH